MNSLLKLATGLALVGMLLPDAGHASDAKAYPVRPVRLVVPFPPAGAMDTLARTLAQNMSESLGQQVFVDNKPGAGGNIGANEVAKSAPDGHTLLIVSVGHAVNPTLYKKLAYDPIKDFEPVSLLAIVPNVLVLHPSLAANSVPELIAQAKAKPGEINYASAGFGTSIHLAGELFKQAAGVDLKHVPYKGSGPAVNDLVGGHVQVMFDSITSARPHIEAGTLKALAVTGARRSPALPALPTLAEAGLPGYEVTPWFGLFAPKGTPEEIIVRLNGEAKRILALPAVADGLAKLGVEPIASTPKELESHLRAESDKWRKVVRDAGIKLE